MLDINLIRNDAEKVKRAIASKNDKIDIDSLLELDARRRGLLIDCEQLRHKRYITSK
jgi:seryl-tRNA synthetase